MSRTVRSGWRARNAADELLEPPRRRGAEGAERHAAAPHRRELADAAGGVVERAQAARRVLGERVAGVGRHDAAAAADEQVGAERALELADLLGDGGLGHAQRLGRRAERAELERGAEAPDLLQRHKLSFWFRQAIKLYLGTRARRSMLRAWTNARRGRHRWRHRRPVGGVAAAPSRRAAARGRDRLGGRLRSDPRGDYWLNYGAHLFPAPGSLVDSMVSDCGLETAPVTGSMMGLAVGSTPLNRGRVETYPFRLPLSVRDRLAFATAGLKMQRAVARYHRLAKPAPGDDAGRRARARVLAFEDDRTFARVPRAAAAGGRGDLLLRRAPRDGRARRAVGRLRHRAVRAGLGRQGLADRPQPARRHRPAARGAGT